MYGTRAWCLVQAITRHTCPDPHLGSWNCFPHQAHIALSERHRPAGFESWLVPNLPLPFIPTLIGLWAFDHVSSRVWWEAATNKQSLAHFLLEFPFDSFTVIRISTVRSTFPLADHPVMKLWILVQMYMSAASFIEFFSGLKIHYYFPIYRILTFLFSFLIEIYFPIRHFYTSSHSPVGWGWLQNTPSASLQKGKDPPPSECPGYATKQSDNEPPVLELWRIWSILSLPLLPDPLWFGVVAPDRVPLWVK